MLNQFSRTQLLFGPEAMERLWKSRVVVFGIGGVGGYAVEALVRSGIGTLDLIDDDSSPKRKKPPTTYTLADKRSFKDITIT